MPLQNQKMVSVLRRVSVVCDRVRNTKGTHRGQEHVPWSGVPRCSIEGGGF